MCTDPIPPQIQKESQFLERIGTWGSGASLWGRGPSGPQAPQAWSLQRPCRCVCVCCPWPCVSCHLGLSRYLPRVQHLPIWSLLTTLACLLLLASQGFVMGFLRG